MCIPCVLLTGGGGVICVLVRFVYLYVRVCVVGGGGWRDCGG